MGAERGQPLDATVSTSGGAQVALKSLRGKPAVVFYEDRGSTGANQALKDELFKAGREQGLLDKVLVIAVANVKGYDWFPARNFVVSAVKDTEKAAGIPVYLDWAGSLAAAPWGLKATGASVVVLDASGAAVVELTGALSAADRARVFTALETELAR